MIQGFIHAGSGVGNQLFRYITTRVVALDKGLDFGFQGVENSKVDTFMHLDYGVQPGGILRHFEEKKVVENGVDIRGYDPEINFIEDNTSIDGEFQDERYWKHRLGMIKKWLQVKPIDMPEDVCVVGFRGGEYVGVSDLFLPMDYWYTAIEIIQKENPDMKFEVHTDDVETAKRFFPLFPIVHNVGVNWRSVRFAKYLIISNSSFFILPAILNENVKKVIAPRYWARRNTGVWALPQNFYSRFYYI